MSAARVLSRALRVVAVIWQAFGLLLLLSAVAFILWRRPREREELRLDALANRDDGPHLFWTDPSHVKVARVRYDSATHRYHGSETVLTVAPGAAWLHLPEGSFPIGPPPPRPRRRPAALPLSATSMANARRCAVSCATPAWSTPTAIGVGAPTAS